MKKLILAFFVLAGLLNACQKAAPQIRISDSWMRALLDNGSAYMIIHNDGNAEDTLLSASTDAAKMLMLHKSSVDAEGVMRMEAVSELKIPAQGKAELKPMSYHLMFHQLKKRYQPGDKVSITLKFKKSGTIPVTLTVRKL